MSDVAERWQSITAELTAECARSGRSADEITLVVVTKFHPASVVTELFNAGARHFGESRHQDAAPKVAELTELDLTWHFVGQIQSNKARAIAQYASVLHSLDRDSVVDALAKIEHRVSGFIELNLTDDPGRGGVDDANAMLTLADRIMSTETIDLLGVMAVAPQEVDPEEAFERVATMSQILIQAHPNAAAISAGMSADWQHAIRHGATHLRIGTSITGKRPSSG
ncbi:MAG: YggS family pyridoxal phosphate-dependent enzyme [Microbacteriaceae bacterium]|nr:YggS family pyridoxal phosphate-dependent enzyme [Microbacteriaceae bacterium]